ncbi:hypothetical protein TNCV_3221581 [Trichonephila clavipes]|nr:hypothetical protein TNCV_3221581 [Trichonephila clavipes]
MSSFLGFCEGDTRNRWRDGQVCPDVDKELWRLGPDGSGVFWRWTSVSRCGQGTMAPWARRLGCEKCWIQVSPVPASDEVCPPVCASYEMCSCVSSTNLKCIMTFLLRERKDVLLEVAKELRVDIDITLPKIEFKKRICQSKYYDEESVSLLEGILEERDQEFEERRLARELELERMRVQLRNKLNENKLKAGNRINDLANVCILSENRTTEVSEPVNKCRPLINPVVNKSVENATSCDFEKKNCDPQ